MMLKGKTVVLGVTGSIAAYKIAYLASALVKLHADVNVIMTHNATNFINPITFETLTGNKCLIDTFDRNFQFYAECAARGVRDRGLLHSERAEIRGDFAGDGIARIETVWFYSLRVIPVVPAGWNYCFNRMILRFFTQ